MLFCIKGPASSVDYAHIYSGVARRSMRRVMDQLSYCPREIWMSDDERHAWVANGERGYDVYATRGKQAGKRVARDVLVGDLT